MGAGTPTADLMRDCRERLNAAAISDALDTLGYHHQTLAPGIRGIDPELVLCGLARVGLYMPLYHDDENTRVYEHEIALVDSLRADEIPVLCCHGITRVSPWGELLSTRARYLGAAGMLTDGSIRDTRKIREMRFPVYSAASNPMDTKFRGKLMLYDVPGEIAGVRIESGDLVFGDVDGIVVIPRAVIPQATEAALAKVSAENTVRDEIRAGGTLVEIFDRHGIL
ncbi:MAG TPA: RraA family protein [Alphaproteobacteria bacterium]|nr:RraA family protein [Alphaproteobacteria bacterium]